MIIINWVSPLSFLGVLGVIFIFYLIFRMKFLKANRISPDVTPQPRSAAILFAYVPQRDAWLIFKD